MNAESNRLCEDCGKIFTGHYSSVCPHNPKPTPPVASMTDAMLAERVWSGDRWTYPNLTTLRQRLAEAEAEKSRLVSAMTAENLRVAADAARWEGAARIMAKEIKVHRWSVDPGHHEETDEAIRITDQHPTASALVREGGGHS